MSPEEQIKHIQSQGFEFMTPMLVFADDYWDEPDNTIPCVEDPCPNCRKITDRVFNMTNTQTIDGIKKQWLLHRCNSCDHTWFEYEEN